MPSAMTPAVIAGSPAVQNRSGRQPRSQLAHIDIAGLDADVIPVAVAARAVAFPFVAVAAPAVVPPVLIGTAVRPLLAAAVQGLRLVIAVHGAIGAGLEITSLVGSELAPVACGGPLTGVTHVIILAAPADFVARAPSRWPAMQGRDVEPIELQPGPEDEARGDREQRGERVRDRQALLGLVRGRQGEPWVGKHDPGDTHDHLRRAHCRPLPL